MNDRPRNPETSPDAGAIEESRRARSTRVIPGPKSGDSLFGGWGPRLF
jgi:hypothetical protein